MSIDDMCRLLLLPEVASIETKADGSVVITKRAVPMFTPPVYVPYAPWVQPVWTYDPLMPQGILYGTSDGVTWTTKTLAGN